MENPQEKYASESKKVVWVCEQGHRQQTATKPHACDFPTCKEAIVGREVKLRERS
jgi:hypothetical protein